MLGSNPAIRRYNVRVLGLSVLYVALLFASIAILTHHPARPLAWGVAILPALPIVGIFAAIGRYLVEERDEYLRALAARQSLMATGFTLSLATVWGFVEDAGLLPHVPAYYAAIVWFAGLGLGGCANRLAEGRGA